MNVRFLSLVKAVQCDGAMSLTLHWFTSLFCITFICNTHLKVENSGFDLRPSMTRLPSEMMGTSPASKAIFSPVNDCKQCGRGREVGFCIAPGHVCVVPCMLHECCMYYRDVITENTPVSVWWHTFWWCRSLYVFRRPHATAKWNPFISPASGMYSLTLFWRQPTPVGY